MNKRIDINGFLMNCEIHAGALPMDTVFIHGNLASNRWWHPTLAVLRERAKPGFEGRAIFAEWRGSGASAAPSAAAELAPAELGDDYVALLEELDVRKACLVGHSTGGLIGLCAMMKKPSLFDRAVLLDSVAADGIKFQKPMYDAFTQMSVDRDFCAAVLGGTIHGNDPGSSHFQSLVDDAFGIAKINWHGVPDALSSVDVSEKLGGLDHPVLVLHGQHDTLLPIEGSRRLAELIPRGSFREIPGQGHCCNVENPGLFVSILNEFLFQR